MALETVKRINVNSYTKVGELTRAIEVWEKVEKSTTDPDQKRIAKEQINQTSQSKAHLINIIQSKFGFLCEESKYKVAQLLKDDGKHKYDNLSVDIMNQYLDHEHQIYADEQTLNAEDSLGMKILEGKTGVDYMTVVKSTMAISAISLLAQGGVFGGIATAISSIMAFNPVVGVCVMALGAASLIKLARKVFAPEIKKLCAQERVRQKFNQIESSSETQVDMDAYKTEEWAQEAKPSETGKPAPEPRTPEGFNNYRTRIAEEAYTATMNGEEYEPPYGDRMIRNEELREIVENAKAKATKELQESKKEKTEEKAEEKEEKDKPTPTQEEMGAELDKEEKALNALDKNKQQAKEAMNKAYKEYHKAQIEGKVSNEELGAKFDKAKRLEEAYNQLEERFNQQKAEYDAKKAKFDETVRGTKPQSAEQTEAKPEEKTATEQPKEDAKKAAETTAKEAAAKETNATETPAQETPTQNANEPLPLKASLGERYRNVAGSIDPTKKAGGQGKTQDAYNKFIQNYKSILRGLANGITGKINQHGKGKMFKNAITDAKEQALKAIGNSEQKEAYEDLFKSLEELVQETAETIEKSTDKNKSAEIVQTNLQNAGFTPDEIEEMLKSPQQQ